MRMKGFDLNLLVALDALLSEQNVSRAAERLNLSQPAASAALARLRTYFQDDILSVSGRRMLPTAHADSLAPLLADAMQAVERLLSTSAEFDPATSQRTFRIVASDYITTVLLTPLLPKLERLAPRVRLELHLPRIALSSDCVIQPSADPAPVSNSAQAKKFGNHCLGYLLY